MKKITVDNRNMPPFLKHAVLWGTALVIVIGCAAALFLSKYAAYVGTVGFTEYAADALAEYDPYVYQKEYLAVSDSKGFVIDLPDVSHAPLYEIVLEGNYTVKYYQGTQYLAKDDISDDNQAITCNATDERKKIVDVPAAAVKAGYDRIELLPYSGSLFTLSYFHALNTLDENVVLQETEAHQVTNAYHNSTVGSQYDVQGLYAFLADWDETTLHLQLESATSELNIQLIDVENGDGALLAEFPADSVLAKIDIDTFDKDHVTLAEYSLPLAASSYEPYDVYVRYRYEGADEIKTQMVEPFVQINEDVYNGTLIRTQDNMASFDNLVLEDGRAYFTGDYIVLTQPLFIPKGTDFVIKAGQTIDFHENAFIFIRSAIYVEGTADAPVLITTTDDSLYSGIAILQASERSTCSYMTCDNLGELSTGIYHLTGAMTFYESDVDFYYCNFQNNRSEDGLNTVRSDITVNNCTFENTYQDAYDSDFCTGEFNGCCFNGTGNDGFDVSTSQFTVSDTSFYNIGDKAISAGEASTVTVVNMYAQDVQTGIGAKDSSVVVATNVTVKDAFIGFCEYQKKPEFGPCSITVTGYSLEGDIDFNYLIEEPDTLIVDGERWVASQKKKQALIIEKMINEEPIR